MHLKRTMAKANSRRDCDRRSNQEPLSTYASRELAANVPGMLLSASLGMAPDGCGTGRTIGVSAVLATLKQMLPPYSSREIVALVHLDRAYALVAQPGPARYEVPKDGVSTIGRGVRFDSVCEFERPLEPSHDAESDALAELVTSAACSGCAANDPPNGAELPSNQSPLHTSIRLRRQLGTSILGTRRSVLTSKGTGSAPIAPE